MTVLEGLGYSGHPCATLLSVAGLLVIMGRFPSGKAVSLRGERPAFTPEDPFTHGQTDNAAHTDGLGHAVLVTLAVHTVHGKRVHLPREAGRAYTPGWEGGIYTGRRGGSYLAQQ